MLKPGLRPRVGVFVEWLSDGYSDPILDEIVAAATEHDVDLLCFVGGLESDDFPAARRHMPSAYASPAVIDGAVIVSLGNAFSSDQIEAYFARFEPIPLCSVAVQWSRYPSVEVDNQTGVRAGVGHLIRNHDRRRIACIRGPESSTEAEKRFAAYRSALDEAGLPFDPALVTHGWYVQQSGIDGVRQLLDERATTFDAIVAANDAMALGALTELERRRIRVPEDVALLGFDDIDAGRHARPPLSTVRQPVRDHGRMAFEQVVRQLHGQPIERRLAIDTELVLRKSCGCLTSRWALFSAAPPPATSLASRVDVPGWVTSCCRELALIFADRRDLEIAPDGLRGELQRDMLAAASGGDGRAFLNRMERWLVDRRKNRDVLQLVPVLDRKRRELRAVEARPEEIERLDVLLSDAAVTVAELAERAQAQQRYRAEIMIDRLLRMDEALLQTVDFDSIARVLAAHLSELGIRACLVCLWEGGTVPAAFATLVAGCADGKAIELPAGGRRFSASDVLPPEIEAGDEPSTWLICPLLRRESRVTAYAAIARGTAPAFVYDGLVDQIGSALKRLELMKQAVEEARLREVAERDRIEREMQIATAIQMGILPQHLSVAGLDVSGCMRPASEVGGDYYDVIPVKDGCWIGIGDVAGHGLPTGLVMLMCQSAIGGLVRNQPEAPPSQLLAAANRVLYDNIRERMREDLHITLALLHYETDGTLHFAGAHESLLIWRASLARVERVDMHGVWTGILDDVSEATPSESVRLAPGDLLVLYTDGITEALDDGGEMFGDERLIRAIEESHDGPVDAVRDRILARVLAWTPRHDDDMTLVVARCRDSAS